VAGGFSGSDRLGGGGGKGRIRRQQKSV
jgi:hypothetical protein